MSRFRMIDVGDKPITYRRAVARGAIDLAPTAMAAIRNGHNPKGDVLALAEIAGVQAVKRTSDWIPLCHPLPIDQARVWFEAEGNSITVFCEVSCHAKTGVEMEALCGVQGALLTIYDLSKAVDPVITIRDTRLELKEGGKNGTWHHPESASSSELVPTPLVLAGFSAAVITLSDRVSAGKSDDLSGPKLSSLVVESGAELRAQETLPDDEDRIVTLIRDLVLERHVDLVLLTGGTGLSARDRTPEAVSRACSRLIPGFGELMRTEGAAHTSMSWLSRSVAGIIGASIVIALPGSPKAVEQGFATLLPLLKHALHTVRGGDHG